MPSTRRSIRFRMGGCPPRHERRGEWYVPRLRAMTHPRSVASDGGEPRPERFRIAELMQLLPRTEEDVLRDIRHVLGIQRAKKHRMDEANISVIQRLERLTVAALGSPHQSRRRLFVIRPQRHVQE